MRSFTLPSTCHQLIFGFMLWQQLKHPTATAGGPEGEGGLDQEVYTMSSQACVPPHHDKHVFCDTSKSNDERVQLLIAELNTNEKVNLIGGFTQSQNRHVCLTMQDSIPRLGIPTFGYLMEDNGGADGTCAAPDRCPTAFSSTTGLAASFNATLWQHKGEIVSDESRAMANLWLRRDEQRSSDHNPNSYPYTTPVGWFDINLERDPRWGRSSEVPGEDAFLTARYATEYTKGLMGNGNMEVVLLFHAVSKDIRATVGDSYPLPRKSLVDFQRVSSVAPSKTVDVVFNVTRGYFLTTMGSSGEHVVLKGDHELIVGVGSTSVSSTWSSPE